MKVRYMYIYVPSMSFKALHGIAKLLLEIEEKQKIEEEQEIEENQKVEEKQKATEVESALWRLSRQVQYVVIIAFYI